MKESERSEGGKRILFLFFFKREESRRDSLPPKFFLVSSSIVCSINQASRPMSAVLRSVAPCAALSSGSRRSSSSRVFAASAPARRVVASRRGVVSCRAHCGVSFLFCFERKLLDGNSALIDLDSNP